MDQTKPTTLMCTPSYAEYLIEKTPKILNKEVRQFHLQKIICSGEPGAGLPEIRKRIREAYGAKLFDSTGAPWGIYSISCDLDEYQGMHMVCEDFHLYYDIIDPVTKKPIEWTDGAIGEKVLTSLDWEAAPPFRYASGDIIQILTEECACGLSGFRIKLIGRMDDMLIIKGINVFPSAIRNIINSFIPRVTGAFKIILENPPPRVVPPLKMKVECGQSTSESEISALKSELEARMSDALRFRPAIECIPPESLERTSGKVKLFERTFDK